MFLFKILGFLLDNEDFMFDKLSLGFGCCEINIVLGFCDVSFLVI